MRTAGWRIIWKKTITVIDATFVTCITGALWAKWGERGIFCCQSILVGVGGWKSQNNGLVMHCSILLETMHPHSLPRYPPCELQYFFNWRSIPHCWACRKRQFPTPELLIDDHIYIFCYIFLIRTKAKWHVFTTFMNVFLSLSREGWWMS